MFERRISIDEVRAAIDAGETIESYPDDVPFPSRLVLGGGSGRPVHVVVANDSENNRFIVITAYRPRRAQWDDTFRTRRRR